MGLWFVVLSIGWFQAPSGDGARLDLQQVIQGNIEARGGEKKWAAVRSMIVKGAYSSFSTPAPFTIYRKRPDLYRFDHFLASHEVIRAYDGEKAWWVNPTYGRQFAKPTPIFEPQHKPTLFERVFDCRLLAYRRAGIPMELVGKEEVDGDPHYKIVVRPENGDEETWYVHAETLLETKLQTTTYIYGGPTPLEVYYSDYREVGGIVLPFLEEQEFHTRARVFELERVEINPVIEDAVFAMPAPEEENP